MSTLQKWLPWNWEVDWRSLLPWNWGRGAPVSHAGEYTLDLSLPGLGPDEIEVEIEGRELVIRGTRHEDEERFEDGRHLRLVRHEVFLRRVHLPQDVDAGEVEAAVEGGVLTVRLPRLPVEEGGPRRIRVQRAA